MTRAIPAIVATALAVVAWSSTSAHAQVLPDFAKIEFRAEPIAPNLYTLTGSPKIDPGHPEAAGGRIAVLVGPEGVLMVDASYAPVTDKVVAAVKQLTAAPIRFVIDTHAHPDHTGGNANLAKLGALVLARDDARASMARPLPAFARAAAAPDSDPTRLPVVTYGAGDPVKIYLNGEVIDLIGVRAAHTSGDTIVRFESSDVIMIGDFYRGYGYPFFDATNGGTLAGLVNAVDIVTRLAGPKTQLVPGHGAIVRREALVAYRDMIVDIEAKVQKLIEAGKTEQEVIAAKLTAPYDTKAPGRLDVLPAGLGTSADRFVKTVYAALKAPSAP
jgi:glyoxylase-like metal-dependent hydrolase (beta-lactamase superfamily II)